MAYSANHLAIGIFLTLMLSLGTTARPEYGAYYNGINTPQFLFDGTGTMDDAMYSDMKKYPESNPTFLSNWPWLRELLPSNDFDDETGSNVEEKYDDIAIPEAIPTPLPLKKDPPAKNMLKDLGRKKNIHSPRRLYMSPCHFKICNMGRKRNARYVRY